MRNRGLLILPAVLVFVVGLCAVAYPLISDRLATQTAAEIVTAATEAVAAATPEEITAALEAAREYNVSLMPAVLGEMVVPTDTAAYNRLLNLSGDGIIGSLSIPRIAVNLPIYHGTDGATLEKGLGHLFGTSLPVGGTGTHTCITGHSGMAGKRMLTDLDQLRLGDTFCLRVLGSELVYRVDQIKTVEPYDASDLVIDPEKDYCTLLTCTPYGVNSHRLLVRGVRVAAEEAAADGTAEADTDSTTAAEAAVPTAPSTFVQQYKRSLATGSVLAIAIVAVTFLFFLLIDRRREKEKKNEENESTS